MLSADSLQQCWYGDRAAPWWTFPVAALYRSVVGARRALYRGGLRHVERLPVPVIVVGNLTAGGSGKTPLVIALVEALRARGLRPGVVSRGYGGSARSPMLLDGGTDPSIAGDEPALVRFRTGAPVAVGAERSAAARLLLGDGVDVIIADDGLQHYAMARDIELCVIDGERRFGNGRLLPAGPLREPVARLREIDFIVCNGGNPGRNEIAMQLRSDPVVNLHDPARSRALRDFAGGRVHAVAGIGNPARFFAMLREHGLEVIEHPFPDHHAYEAGDLAFRDDLPLLMTEKDAVKCRAFAKGDWWGVPVSAVLAPSFFDVIVGRLRQKQR